MSFTSELFLIFIAVVAVVYWFVPASWRGWFLTVCSYGFYVTWDPPMAAVMAIVTVICYAGAIVIGRSAEDKSRARVAFGITGALVAYVVVFKALPLVGSAKDIVIPLGVSYYTFKLISYVLDVYWGQLKPETHLGRFAAFVAFFPQIVAGPIQRADSFFEQFEHAKAPTLRAFTYGSARILIGLFKKLFVADHLLVVIAPVFANPATMGPGAKTAAFYLFTVQLYADFSALTDIANGTGLLLGMEGVENFNLPFLAPSVSDFWRRWHMSLTGWLRDYVFMPSRMAFRNLGQAGLMLSITVNMMLVALWHSFSLNFIVFGLIHSFLLCIDALTIPFRKRLYKQNPRMKIVTAILGPIFTYHVFALTNVCGAREPSPTLSRSSRVWAGGSAGPPSSVCTIFIWAWPASSLSRPSIMPGAVVGKVNTSQLLRAGAAGLPTRGLRCSIFSPSS